MASTEASASPSRNSGGTEAMLPAERARASFDVNDLLPLIAGKRPQRIAEHAPLFDKPPFNDHHLDDFRSYDEIFSKSISRVAAAFDIVRSNPKFRSAHIAQQVTMADMFDHNGIFLHFTMMLNFIKAQGNKEQQKKWLKRAMDGSFIAAYCQTELGHGSNVRGLETNATFDPSTQEFEIDSPTLTSMKWWPTGMYACTHALVFANLISGGVRHGFHGFMVQLRQADGSLMPGVEVGEVGPKMNTRAANIGYCRFSQVRIPKDNLFSKNSDLTPEGKYIAAPPKLSKLRYISMMLARTAIVSLAYTSSAKAATIAVRYSCVRRQGFKNSGDEAGGENVVMDYQMQQYRVFKGLATAFCIFWNGRYINSYIQEVQQKIQGGDEAAADDLPELHATVSGMKVATTVRAHEAIEECRKCCGGQGFVRASGVGRLSPDFSEWVTVEGEQVILNLQLARFLIKACRDVNAGTRVAESVRYLEAKRTPGVPTGCPSLQQSLELMAERSRRLSFRLTSKMDDALAEGQSFDEALGSLSIAAYRAANAHSFYFIAQNNLLGLDKFLKDRPAVHAALLRLLELLCLAELSERGGDWASGLNSDILDSVNDRLPQLLREIRPDAVALVDCFGFTDSQLDSTIGRADGNVYEAIYEQAKLNPLNQTATMVGWEAYSKVLDLEFLREEAPRQRVAASKL